MHTTTVSDLQAILKVQEENERALNAWLIELAKTDNKKATEIRELMKQAYATVDSGNNEKLTEIQNKIQALCQSK